MATVTRVMLTCDVCGNAKDVQTWTFGLEGKTYEIDLCPKDGKDLDKVAAGYISKARQTAARQGQRRGGRRPPSRSATAATGDRPRTSQKESPSRSRVTNSSQEEAKASRSQRRAAKVSGTEAKAASSSEEANASRSRPQKAKTAGPSEEAKASRSHRRAAKVSGTEAKAASSSEEANASRSRPQKAKTAGPSEEAKASRSEPRDGKAASKQATKATGVPQDKGVYVYGILPADIEVAAGQPGVGEHPGPLRAVRSDGLAALISEVDLSGRPGSPDDLRTYREILNATATELPVLPLRFGTVLTSEDAVVEELLTAHHDEFTDALEQLEGRAEFVVKGRYVEAAGLGEITARREEDARALEQAMERVCVASVAREPAHELDAVHVAFLVAADEEDEMERVIEDLAREWEGRIDVQLLGPMAAYDFTGTAKQG